MKVAECERNSGASPTATRPDENKTAPMSTTAKEQQMTTMTDIFTPVRELAHRDADGIEVTLLWDAYENRAFVVVVDSRRGTAFEVEVGDASPMHVFHHPYVYCVHELAA